MIINSNNTTDAVTAKGARSKPASQPSTENSTKANSPAAPAKGASDQVVLSQEAQTLGRLQSKINQAPEIDLDKVAEIRQAIAEGRFEINPERIAENMLNQNELLR